jgi:hypothetical protein
MTKDEALKLALETAEGIANCDWRKWEELASPKEFERWVKSRALHLATAVKEALAQPEQEPVAIYRAGQAKGEVFHVEFLKEMGDDEVLLYTTPPQRPWVGLTDENVNSASVAIDARLKLAFHTGMYVAQKILMEKNT